jgi:hypothetical protein
LRLSLKSDSWHLHAKQGQKFVSDNTNLINVATASVIAYASLDEDLFLLLHKAEAREAFANYHRNLFSDKANCFLRAIAENQEINVIEKFAF